MFGILRTTACTVRADSGQLGKVELGVTDSSRRPAVESTGGSSKPKLPRLTADVFAGFPWQRATAESMRCALRRPHAAARRALEYQASTPEQVLGGPQSIRRRHDADQLGFGSSHDRDRAEPVLEHELHRVAQVSITGKRLYVPAHEVHHRLLQTLIRLLEARWDLAHIFGELPHVAIADHANDTPVLQNRQVVNAGNAHSRNGLAQGGLWSYPQRTFVHHVCNSHASLPGFGCPQALCSFRRPLALLAPTHS